MKIRLVSDLHLEHSYDLFSTIDQAATSINKLLPPLENDADTVLVIAGDVAPVIKVKRTVNLLRAVVERFYHVIYVLGNHEYYHTDIQLALELTTSAIIGAGIDMSKITIAGNDVVRKEIGATTFLCTTLWTDFSRGNVQHRTVAGVMMNDYRMILNGSTRLTPLDTAAVHARAVEQLQAEAAACTGTIVVVSHHIPSYSAVNKKYMSDITSRAVTSAFASDLDELILDMSPRAWFFGHTHTPFEGNVGRTLLACNPLGYPSEKNFEQRLFNTKKVYEL